MKQLTINPVAPAQLSLSRAEMTEFQRHWAAMLWAAMTKTGEGYRRPSQVERPGPRPDKDGRYSNSIRQSLNRLGR